MASASISPPDKKSIASPLEDEYDEEESRGGIGNPHQCSKTSKSLLISVSARVREQNASLRRSTKAMATQSRMAIVLPFDLSQESIRSK